MTIYIDVDGTLTETQSRWAEPNYPMIDKVKKLIADGHDIIIWSGGMRYAQRFCKKYGLTPTAALAKPRITVDNQAFIRRRINVLTPEKFLEMDIE